MINDLMDELVELGAVQRDDVVVEKVADAPAPKPVVEQPALQVETLLGLAESLTNDLRVMEQVMKDVRLRLEQLTNEAALLKRTSGKDAKIQKETAA